MNGVFIEAPLSDYLLKFFKSNFDTKTALAVRLSSLSHPPLRVLSYFQDVRSTIVIVHAENDFDIPLAHSIDLFDTLLEPSLPPRALTVEQLSKPMYVTHDQWMDLRKSEEVRRGVRATVVRNETIPHLGDIFEFNRVGNRGKVAMLNNNLR